MSVFEYIIGGILILFALLVIVVVLLQEGHQANVGVISGTVDSFMDKGKAKTWDARLAKWTKVIAISFFVLVFVGMLTTKFLNKETLSKNTGDNDTSITTSDVSSSDVTSSDVPSSDTTASQAD